MSSTKSEHAAPAHDQALVQKHTDAAAQDQPGRAIPDVPVAQHVNHTPFWSQYFQSVDSTGEVFHTVVTRVSYDMASVARGGAGDNTGSVLSYCAEQGELAMGDVFADPAHPHGSDLLWESDFCAYKPRCDVLVINAATRPPMGPLSQWQRAMNGGNLQQTPAAARWSCGVGLGYQDDSGQRHQWQKTLVVTGPRGTTLMGAVGQPQEVHEVRLSWLHAFGGPDDERNPLGVGHTSSSDSRQPQQELQGTPYRGGNYPPVHLGPVGKAWLPRRALAGTYDEAWLKHQWPLPPGDLDDGFWNCAPVDQQIRHPEPGAQIALINLWPPTPENELPAPPPPGHEVWRARLPLHQLFVQPIYRAAHIGIVTKDPILPCKLDTLRLDLQAQRVEAVYRARVPQSAFGHHTLVRMETRMSPVGLPLESVPLEQMGPLGQ
ncbi:DUF2169 family type VI secretion system accessory protein [Acidovorax sp. LjRoot117]|uniref:DUF2169 family type VI secretion system accessory protein n=1 Tax=Acidovorax sp. LjRoot117 TaxID=3342255 RepID=UPI003ECF749B